MNQIQNTKKYDLEDRTFLFSKNIRKLIKKIPKKLEKRLLIFILKSKIKVKENLI